jgi:hypothetical protein
MVAVIAEVDGTYFLIIFSFWFHTENAWNKRFEQGWIQRKETDVEVVVRLVKEAKKNRQPLSIGWLVHFLLFYIFWLLREILSHCWNVWWKRVKIWLTWPQTRLHCTIHSKVIIIINVSFIFNNLKVDIIL